MAIYGLQHMGFSKHQGVCLPNNHLQWTAGRRAENSVAFFRLGCAHIPVASEAPR